MKLCPVVLAGGSGTRLWPLSRKTFPKQLLPLHSKDSLLQETVVRLDGLEAKGKLEVMGSLMVCNEEQRFLVAEQLREIGRDPWRILLEPIGRNTAPALTFAALLAASREPEETVLVVMAADHVIQDNDAFHAAILKGVEIAEKGLIGTFGIVPDRPETGYGYIKKGLKLDGLTQDGTASPKHPDAFRLDAFVEKPDPDTAQRYLASGEYLWNSGMFIMSASVWLKVMERYQPRMLEVCRNAVENGDEDGAFLHLAREALDNCPSDSIDYAIMERLTGVESEPGVSGDDLVGAAVIPLDAGWSDIGAWSALMEIRDADGDGNVTDGDVFTWETRNSLLISNSRLLTAVGMEDTVVIETADAVLVCPKERSQDVKRVVEWLKAQDRDESRTHRRVYQPWGSYDGLESDHQFQVKRLTINPGQTLSLRMPQYRSAHWVVVRGTAQVTRDGEVLLLDENQSTEIPAGTEYQAENTGNTSLEIVEVQVERD